MWGLELLTSVTPSWAFFLHISTLETVEAVKAQERQKYIKLFLPKIFQSHSVVQPKSLREACMECSYTQVVCSDNVLSSSQFPLCNRYVGEWRNGQREGQGTFHYARSEGSQQLWWGLACSLPSVLVCACVLQKKKIKKVRDREGNRDSCKL